MSHGASGADAGSTLRLRENTAPITGERETMTDHAQSPETHLEVRYRWISAGDARAALIRRALRRADARLVRDRPRRSRARARGSTTWCQPHTLNGGQCWMDD
jgi:hypothetical protein